MAELDGPERIAAFTEDIMGGNIAVPALPVENVEHLLGHRAIHLDQAQDVSESGFLIDRHAGTLGDPYRKALRELSGLDQTGVRIVDEVAPAKRPKAASPASSSLR
jgi:hypothetical protein